MAGTDSHTTSHGALNSFAFGIGATADRVVNKTTGKTFAVVPLPKARQAIIDAGGLIAYTRKRVMEAAAKA